MGKHLYGVKVCFQAGRVLTAAVPALLLLCGVATAESKFEKASIHLERNATDDDIEVVVSATSNEKGLAALRVIAPDGRIVVDFKAPDSKLGIRHVDLESPEPPLNDGRLQADFPQGVYRFEGTLVDGEGLRSEATLSHALPDATTIAQPAENQKEMPTQGGKVQWSEVKDASYVVILQEKGKKREMRLILPEGTTSLNIPNGFLIEGAAYKVEVGVVLRSGNRVFVKKEVAAVKR